MKLYVAGAMSGQPNHGFPSFFEAERQLRDAGYDVFNPADNEPPGLTWEEYLRDDIKALLDCEAVATIPGWETSRGANLEVYIAVSIGMQVLPVSTWVTLAHAPATTSR